MFEVSDFFPYYPNTKDPNFYKDLNRKQEFKELESSEVEDRPSKYYKHQEFTIRYMDNYNRLLCIHEPGTGKSCIIIGSAEHYKNNSLKDPNDPTTVKRAIILIKNAKLKTNIRDEIVKVCAPGIYNNPNDPHEQFSMVTRRINKWYDIITYYEFVKNIRNMKGNEEEIDKYLNGCVIYVDEAHNLNVTSDKDLQYQSNITVEDEDYEDIPEDDENSSYQVILNTLKRKSIKGVYLFTATPIIDNVKEFTKMCNLILDRNDEIPINENLELMTDEELTNLFKTKLAGKISYVRSLDTGVNQYNLTNPSMPSLKQWNETHPTEHININTSVYILEMGKYQKQAYKEHSFYMKRRDDMNSKIKNTSFHQNERQISNIVIPGYNNTLAYTIDEMKPLITTSDKQYQLTDPILRNELVNNLQDYSCKLNFIVNKSIECYETTNLLKKGVTFVFSPDYVVATLGPLIAILKAKGFEEYTETSSHLPRPGRRFCVITSETPDTVFRSMYNVLKSPQNMFGDIISVVIASRIAQEGISINNVSQSFIISSPWNPGRYIQAYNRVFRNTSHTDKIQYLRSDVDITGSPKVRQLGENERLTVDVYNLAAVYDINDYYSSVDLRLYEISDEKYLSIARVMRKCKEYAIDSYPHRRRNFRITDQDYSPACDFMMCDYKLPITAEDIADTDYSTKLMYYSRDEVDYIKDIIYRTFKEKSQLSLNDIYNIFKDKMSSVYEKYIYFAIEEIMVENFTIKDKYGFNAKINVTNNNDIYLNKYDISDKGHNNLNIVYAKNINVNQDISLNLVSEYNKSMNYTSKDKIVEDIINNSVSGDVDIEDLLSSIPIISIPGMIESILSKIVVSNSASYLHQNVLSYFNHSIYVIPNRERIIQQIVQENISKKPGRGRPSKNFEKVKIPDDYIDYTYNADGYVLVHTLVNNTSMNVYYNENNVLLHGSDIQRIYDYSTNTWRTTNGNEAEVYKRSITYINENNIAPFKGYDYFGIRIHLRDVYKIVKNKKNLNVMDDKRQVYKGKNCNNWNVKELIDIATTYLIIDNFPDLDFDINYINKAIAKLNNRSQQFNKLIKYSQQYNILPKLNYYSKLIIESPIDDSYSIQAVDIYLKILIENMYNSKTLKTSTLCNTIYIYMFNNKMIYTGNNITIDQILQVSQVINVKNIETIVVDEVEDQYESDNEFDF